MFNTIKARLDETLMFRRRGQRGFCGDAEARYF
jgi:succinate dehydrogenase/fumarate reductase-like Fe-S protein